MKRRIFVYHTLTVLAALVTLLVVSGGVMGWVTHRYQEWSRSAMDDRAEKVQALLSDSSGTDWGRLDAQLRELGYHLRVCQNGRELYSSLDPFQENAYQRFSADAVWPPNGTHTIQNDGILMIGTQNGPYTIVAMSRPHIPEVFGRQRPQSEAVMLALITSGLTAIVLIVLLSLLFTNHQVKQLMRPVNALADAAQRVERGDLSRPVDYHGKDEFASVCAAFDHMQRHLLAEREKNAAYEQARTDLVAGISHDLRTPMTSIAGFIDGILEGAIPPEKQPYYLGIIGQEVKRLSRLVSSLLDISRMESGNRKFEKTPFDICEMARIILLSFEAKIDSKKLDVEFDAPEDKLIVYSDKDAINQVLYNICDNAVKFSKDGGKYRISITEEQTKVVVKIYNEGVGISAEDIPHVFDRFYKSDKSRGLDKTGVGLGLYICKTIMDNLGEDISVSSRQGEYCEFTIKLTKQKGKGQLPAQ